MKGVGSGYNGKPRPAPASRNRGIAGQTVLRQVRVFQRLDCDGVLAQAAGWLGEKVSRLKLRHPAADPLGTLEALEVLALGILGKRALWNALAIVAPRDGRVAGHEFERRAARADDQHTRVEARRLAAAPHVFQKGNRK